MITIVVYRHIGVDATLQWVIVMEPKMMMVRYQMFILMLKVQFMYKMGYSV